MIRERCELCYVKEKYKYIYTYIYFIVPFPNTFLDNKRKKRKTKKKKNSISKMRCYNLLYCQIKRKRKGNRKDTQVGITSTSTRSHR